MIIIRTMTALSLVTVLASCEPAAQPADSKPGPSGATSLDVKVDGSGYHPERISAPPGKPVRLTITRTSDEGCGQQIVFPSLDIRRDLPLNRPVAIDFPMPASGSVDFTCGMDMLKGSIVAE